MPIKRNKSGDYLIPSGTLVYTCLTSDFFIEESDEWRAEAWQMMKSRSDINFFIFTKRIDRANIVFPEDWCNGYDNVIISCSIENQEIADYRVPLLKKISAKHKVIIVAPMIGKVDLACWLDDTIELVSVGGESGSEARILDYDWVLDIRRQCIEKNIPFRFQQTGAKLQKDGRVYRILRKYQHSQAHRAGIDYGLIQI